MFILYTVYSSGGNAVGPYKDHFWKGQKDGKKVNFEKIKINMLIWD
jgi:hypothetical protein